MLELAQGLGLVLAAGLFACLSGYLLLIPPFSKSLFPHYLMGFASGFLPSAALLLLLPEAIDLVGDIPQAMEFTLTGLLLTWFTDHQLENRKLPSLRILNLITDSLLCVGLGWYAVPFLRMDSFSGQMASLTVLLWLFPKKASDTGILGHTGLTLLQALRFHFLILPALGLGLLTGLLLTPYLPEDTLPYLNCSLSGSLLYLSLHHLLPGVANLPSLKKGNLYLYVSLCGLGASLLLRFMGNVWW
jgi:zinc transporter ZupT